MLVSRVFYIVLVRINFSMFNRRFIDVWFDANSYVVFVVVVVVAVVVVVVVYNC